MMHDCEWCRAGYASLPIVREKLGGCGRLPKTPMLALRSKIPKRIFLHAVLRHYERFLDDEAERLRAAERMILHINRADGNFSSRCKALRDQDRLPLWWDGLTRWKFAVMVGVFDANQRRDAELLRILRERQAHLDRSAASPPRLPAKATTLLDRASRGYRGLESTAKGS